MRHKKELERKLAEAYRLTVEEGFKNRDACEAMKVKEHQLHYYKAKVRRGEVDPGTKKPKPADYERITIPDAPAEQPTAFMVVGSAEELAKFARSYNV